MRDFHVNVFGTMLRLGNNSQTMIVDFDRSPTKLLIAPLIGVLLIIFCAIYFRYPSANNVSVSAHTIDFKLIERVNEGMKTFPRAPTLGERQWYEFKREKFSSLSTSLCGRLPQCFSYSDAVVAQWYRKEDIPTYFYVRTIEENLSPATSFPCDKYASYTDYYRERQNVTIYNQQQPMLGVEETERE